MIILLLGGIILLNIFDNFSFFDKNYILLFSGFSITIHVKLLQGGALVVCWLGHEEITTDAMFHVLYLENFFGVKQNSPDVTPARLPLIHMVLQLKIIAATIK